MGCPKAPCPTVFFFSWAAPLSLSLALTWFFACSVEVSACLPSGQLVLTLGLTALCCFLCGSRWASWSSWQSWWPLGGLLNSSGSPPCYGWSWSDFCSSLYAFFPFSDWHTHMIGRMVWSTELVDQTMRPIMWLADSRYTWANDRWQHWCGRDMCN